MGSTAWDTFALDQASDRYENSGTGLWLSYFSYLSLAYTYPFQFKPLLFSVFAILTLP